MTQARRVQIDPAAITPSSTRYIDLTDYVATLAPAAATKPIPLPAANPRVSQGDQS
jgi:hypothetical protein